MEQAAVQLPVFSDQLAVLAVTHAAETAFSGPGSSNWIVPTGPFSQQLGPPLELCDRSCSGTSAVSNDLCLPVLVQWQQEALAVPFVQQQCMHPQQHAGLSPGKSCQSTLLDVELQQMFSGQVYQQQPMQSGLQQQQQQEDPPEGDPWHLAMQDPAAQQAAPRVCEEQLSLDQEQQQQLDSTMLLGITGSGDFLQDNKAAAAAGYSPDLSSVHSGSGCLTSPSLAAAGEDASGEGAADCAGDVADCSGSKPVLPNVSLRVACGDMVGTLLVHRARIVINEGTGDDKEVSPTEFERLGGRSATKKWKQSIRLVNDDGELGRPVGEWYVMQGLEQPKKPREPKDGVIPGSNNSSTARSSSPPPDQRSSKHAASAKPAAAPVHKRPVRAAARNVERHFAAEAASSPELVPTPALGRAASRRSGRGAARAAAPVKLEDDVGSGSGTADSPDLVVDAAALAAAAGGGGASMLLHEQASWNTQQQQQQQQMHGMMSRAASGQQTAADEAAINEATAAALDAAAQGDYQLPPGAAAAAAALPSAGSSGGVLLVAVPVAQPLPGDASQAVIEMTSYLEGRRSSPPWRLLPLTQRPLVGRFLVPLRQLLVLVMRAGGYLTIKDDLLLWKDLACQLGLPAQPCIEVPDPLRTLQQVYRDYLLRFEGRFSLPEQPPAAAAGGVHQSPPLSTAPQYPSSQQQQLGGMGSSQQQQQQLGGMGSMGGVLMPPPMLPGVQIAGYAMAQSTDVQQQQQPVMFSLQGSRECPSPAAAVAVTADNNNVATHSSMQPGQQRLHAQFSVAAGMVLDDTLSADLFDLLTDLIPDNDAVLPAACSGMQQQQQPSALTAAAAAVLQQQGEVAGSSISLQRQHPEMTLVQQRHRLQQLQAQLQQQQQQQQGSEVQLGTAAARAKRPPPLIRCGDSDVVSLMDQQDVSRLLQDYQQQPQQRHTALRQQQLSPMRQQQQQAALSLQGWPPRPAASQLAAAVAGAVDRDLSQDLQALMQSYWQQQQQQGSAPGQQQQQQQQQEHVEEACAEFEGAPEPQVADDVMSGMLEALQLAADGQPLSEQQQQPGAFAGQLEQQDGSGTDGKDAVWSGSLMPVGAHLFAQGSVGAHLVSMMPKPGGGQDLSGQGGAGGSGSSSSRQHGGMLPAASDHHAAMLAPPPVRPSTAAAAADGAGDNTNNNQQQQQQQVDPGLQAFEGGLLRLTTPSSALIGSVLNSPTLRNVGGGGSSVGWMDISEQVLQVQRSPLGDLRSMADDLTRNDDQCGPPADDFAAVLHMW